MRYVRTPPDRGKVVFKHDVLYNKTMFVRLQNDYNDYYAFTPVRETETLCFKTVCFFVATVNVFDINVDSFKGKDLVVRLSYIVEKILHKKREEN